jgi:signal transduction histidine kinase
MICKEFVEKQGGIIRVESTKGIGKNVLRTFLDHLYFTVYYTPSGA